jgi:hypothetical protein
MSNATIATRARRIIERLKMFNRKERDHLMKFALCEKPEAPEISSALWKLVSRNNGTNCPDADNIFIGMDYHLNWLYAALATNEIGKELSDEVFENDWKRKRGGKGNGEGNFKWPSENEKKKSGPIRGNQEDVDLLVAWRHSVSARLQIVLIEAKLDSGWGSTQFESKKERLTLIREDARNRGLDFIDWRFLLLSPGNAPTKNQFNPEEISESCYWMLINKTKDQKGMLWHEELPITTNLRRVKRETKDGLNWTTIPSKPATKKEDGSKG